MRKVLAMTAWFFLAGEAQAVTHYNVRLNTTARLGQVALLTFDLTSHGPAPDTLEIVSFGYDGKTRPIASPGLSYFEGGPVRGHLLANVNPAPRTVIGNDFFFNSLGVPFDSLGTAVTFGLQLPEPSPPEGLPDEMSFFYLGDDGMPAFHTLDPLGTDALFAVCVTGEPGGDLSVFTPMTFVPPDSLVLDMSVLGVPGSDGLVARLQFRSIAPNPSTGGVRLAYAIPEPGGELRVRVFDVAGRLVAQPVRGKRAAGSRTTDWDARDSRGRAALAGVYLVQLQMGGQSLVRRVVLTP